VKSILAAILVFISANVAHGACAPWTVYGQTSPVYNGAVDNPPANVNGLIGEASLPYTVPDGKVLVITAYGLEAYAQVANGLVLAPYLGATPPKTNGVFLHSVYANDASNETVGVRFHIPAGKVLNVRLMSNENPAQVVGWYIAGELCDAQ
jgi:hypothetical protein